MKKYTLRQHVEPYDIKLHHGKPVGFDNILAENAILKMLKPQKGQDLIENLELGDITIYEGGYSTHNIYTIWRTDGGQLEEFIK